MPLKISSPHWPWIIISVLLLPTVIPLLRTVLIKTVLSVEKECFFCNRKTVIYFKRNILTSKLLEYIYPLFHGFYGSYGGDVSDDASTRPIPGPVLNENGTLKHWFCKNCDSYNVYDDNGNLITPNKQTEQSDLLKPAPRNRSPNSKLYFDSGTRHFCDKCIENQELNRLSLALVSNEDDYDGNPVIEAHLDAQYRRVSERFPVVCSSCSRRVERYITFLNKRLSQRPYNYSLVVNDRSGRTRIKTFVSAVKRYVRTKNYLKYGAFVLTVYFCITGLILVKSTIEFHILAQLLGIASNIFSAGKMELSFHSSSGACKSYCDITPLSFCVRIIPMYACLEGWLHYFRTRRCLLMFSYKFVIYSSLRTSLFLLLAAIGINVGISLKSELNHTAFFISYTIFVLMPVYKLLVTLCYAAKSSPTDLYYLNHRDQWAPRLSDNNTSEDSNHQSNDSGALDIPNKSLFWDPVEGWVNKPPNLSVSYHSSEDLNPLRIPLHDSNILKDTYPLLKSHKSITEHIATLHIGSPKPGRLKSS